MDRNRLIQLKKMHEESPEDPFILYALAMEYIDQNKSMTYQYFTELLARHPDYLPTYFHAANLFAEREEIDRARLTFEKGMKLARRKEDTKTFQEIQNSYQNFIFENEE